MIRIAVLRALGLALVASITAPSASPLHAQVMSGEVQDAAGKIPVPMYEVRLVRLAGSTPVVVDSSLTDSRGRFQFNLAGEGIYQLRVGPRHNEFRDPQVDTVAVGDVVLRRVQLPSAFWNASAATTGGATTGGATTVDARFDRGFRGPAYPRPIRATGLNGLVLAFFSVGNDGRLSKPDIRSTNPAFAREVGDWLSRLRLLPASRDGVSVSQLMCLQVVFLVSATPQVLPKVTSMPDLTANEDERALCARFSRHTITVVTGR